MHVLRAVAIRERFGMAPHGGHLSRNELRWSVACLLATLAIAPLRVVGADLSEASKSTDPCVTQRDTAEMTACASNTFASKDAEMNQAYKALLLSLASQYEGGEAGAKAARKLLVEAQRAWIKFRDHDCEGQYKLWQDGSIRGIIHYGCLTDRTEQRTKELQNWTGEAQSE